MMDFLTHIDYGLLGLCVAEFITLAALAYSLYLSITEDFGMFFTFAIGILIIIELLMISCTIPYINYYEPRDLHYLEVK